MSFWSQEKKPGPFQRLGSSRRCQGSSLWGMGCEDKTVLWQEGMPRLDSAQGEHVEWWTDQCVWKHISPSNICQSQWRPLQSNRLWSPIHTNRSAPTRASSGDLRGMCRYSPGPSFRGRWCTLEVRPLISLWAVYPMTWLHLSLLLGLSGLLNTHMCPRLVTGIQDNRIFPLNNTDNISLWSKFACLMRKFMLAL